MNSIIQEIYYGNFNPSEHNSEFHDPIKSSSSAVCKAEEALLEQFPECKPLLNALSESYSIYISESESAQYVKGFRHGVQIIIDSIKT